MNLRAFALVLPLVAFGCSSQKSPEPKAATKPAVTQLAVPVDKAGKGIVAAAIQPAPTPVDADGKIAVEANANGFSPKTIYVEAGKPVTLVVTRTVEKTCMDGIVIPSLEIEKELAVGVPVEVAFTPEAAGTIGFQCPMGHGKSSIVVLPKS